MCKQKKNILLKYKNKYKPYHKKAIKKKINRSIQLRSAFGVRDGKLPQGGNGTSRPHLRSDQRLQVRNKRQGCRGSIVIGTKLNPARKNKLVRFKQLF